MLKKIIKYLKKILEKDNSVLFIGASDKLLPPLSKEEELDLARKNCCGDIDARNRLIEHNLRLVVFLAKKYETTGYDLEDLVSIGSVGLIKGIDTYKPDKNIKLATYVSRCICNEILMYIRKNKKKKLEVNLEDTLNFDAEGNTLNLEDVLGTEKSVDDEYFEKCEKNLLQKELNNLNEKEKLIMSLRYGLNNKEEYTQKEVADMLGISQSYISRIEHKIINKLKSTINFC